MREIGLHLRVDHSLGAVLDKAVRHNLSFFQCFFLQGSTGRRIAVSNRDITQFRNYRVRHFNQLYVHGSYWINLADTTRITHPALNYEIALAKKLSFTHIVLHPGSCSAQEKKIHGIDALARSLNTVLKKESDITIVLENTAHGNRSVGSNIADFNILLEKIDRPDHLQFCIDTAHAFAYGYDITTEIGREQFIATLDDAIGIERIALMHVNDSQSACGSRVDRHALLNEGYIKEEPLKHLVLDTRLAHIPLVLELPVVTDQQEAAILEKVHGWHRD